MENRRSVETFETVAEIELVYKSRVKASQRPQIISASDAYEVLLKLWDDGKLDLL